MDLLKRGLKYREVAEELGISVNTVKVLVYRIKRKLSSAGVNLSRNGCKKSRNPGRKVYIFPERVSRKPAKFTSRTSPLAFRVLLAISKGYDYGAQIARKLGVKKDRVYRILRKLEDNGLVRVVVRSNIKIYELTDAGRAILQNSNVNLKVRNGNVGGDVCFRVDRFSLRFPVFREGVWPGGGREWEVRGWRARSARFGNVTLVRTSRSVIAYLRSFYGGDPWRALFDAYNYVLRVVAEFAYKYGWELGIPVPNGKPHFEFPDPFVRESGKVSTVKNGLGFVDASPGEGEIGFLDPELADRYIRMVTEVPEKVSSLEQRVAKIENVMERLSESLEVFAKGMEQHMMLISHIQELVLELREVVKGLKGDKP